MYSVYNIKTLILKLQSGNFGKTTEILIFLIFHFIADSRLAGLFLDWYYKEKHWKLSDKLDIFSRNGKTIKYLPGKLRKIVFSL